MNRIEPIDFENADQIIKDNLRCRLQDDCGDALCSYFLGLVYTTGINTTTQDAHDAWLSWLYADQIIEPDSPYVGVNAFDARCAHAIRETARYIRAEEQRQLQH